MDKGKSSKTPTPYNFSQNSYFRLEHISTFNFKDEKKAMPAYLESRYCSYLSNPSIISCRAFDNSISFTLDLLFPTFDEGKDIKIVTHEFESIEILNTNQSKVVYDKITMNKNELRFLLMTVKFKINVSVDPLKGNFAILQTGEHIYSLFMNDHNVLWK